MKTLLRNSVLNAFALFLLPEILPKSLTLFNGVQTAMIAGVVLALLTLIVRPILKIISFPITIISFGLFSYIIDAVILYLLTILVPQIKIAAFTFQGLTFAGFVIPKVSFNLFFAYIVVSLVYWAIVTFINWLFD